MIISSCIKRYICKSLIVLSFFLVFSGLNGQEPFRDQQLSYARVRDAYDLKLESITKNLEELDLDLYEIELYLLGYKQEKVLEVWAKNISDSHFKKVKDYKFCTLSGTLGPKRQQGDMQVPEGFYFINIFNPWSNFHLSLGLDYPNQSDRILGVAGRLGGDIYIHGSCVSIGCIPITDRNIKELYVLCVEARNNGQDKIPVHLYPARMEEGTRSNLIERYKPDNSTINLWQDLQISYDYFKKIKSVPEVSFLSNGRHQIK